MRGTTKRKQKLHDEQARRGTAQQKKLNDREHTLESIPMSQTYGLGSVARDSA
jgi:hypothetical protein